jgi:hypothetical protein
VADMRSIKFILLVIAFVLALIPAIAYAQDPTPTAIPTETPVDPPTAEPTPVDPPTAEPTPGDPPTVEPTPTETPTVEPTSTETPTAEPTPTTEPTATFTPPPAATPKTTATEPAATATGNPGGTPIATATAPPTATPTAVATEAGLGVWIDVQPTTTEGDRFLVTLLLNRTTECDTHLVITGDGTILPNIEMVVIPAGQRSVSFFLVAIDDGTLIGSRVVDISIDSVSGCELPAYLLQTDQITIYDPSTNIPGEDEPTGPGRLYLPIVVMGVSMDGSGVLIGFILIVGMAAWYVKRRK